MRRLTAAVVAVALLAGAAPVSAATYSFNVTLLPQTGLPGDPSANGSASISMNDSTNQVCWTVTTSGLAGPTSGGIYQGARGQPASPVPLVAFTTMPNGCSPAPGAIAVMVRCPAQFNVTVRSASNPIGIRGQLGTTCSV